MTGLISRADAPRIGAAMRELRIKHGYSLRRLSTIANVSISRASNVEHGLVFGEATALRKMAAALGVTEPRGLSTADDAAIETIADARFCEKYRQLSAADKREARQLLKLFEVRS